MNSAQNQLKTGKRPIQQQIRVYKAGEVLFEEGSTGRELFIVQEGRVGVYKDTADGKVELAVIEKGGIIGEMALLDDLPRSATVKALSDAKALVINQSFFQSVFKATPVWLQSIVKIVVSRLRDANKRVDQSALRDKVRGIVSLILLLLPANKKEIRTQVAIDYNLVVTEGFFVTRLRKKEIQKILESLSKRGILRIDPEKKEEPGVILITDLEVLQLYNEYLLLRSQKKTFKECLLSEDVVGILSNIAYVAQKSGQETGDGTVLMKSALLEDLSEDKLDLLEKSLMDLRRKNLINLFPSDEDTAIVFSKEVIIRIKKIKEWMPAFEMEVL
ncbi:MAG TPA: cyclic nucleotide-binding domain-containing protein [Chitinispirillaceae bacterium]|nr:cyclic nucleotide-binding domain-containing protein [Chitinispirillaceae bacterium]